MCVPLQHHCIRFSSLNVHFLSALLVFGMVITIGQGTAYVLSGMYGDVRDLGIGNSVLIVLQLFFAGIVVLVLVRHRSVSQENL